MLVADLIFNYLLVWHSIEKVCFIRFFLCLSVGPRVSSDSDVCFLTKERASGDCNRSRLLFMSTGSTSLRLVITARSCYLGRLNMLEKTFSVTFSIILSKQLDKGLCVRDAACCSFSGTMAPFLALWVCEVMTLISVT